MQVVWRWRQWHLAVKSWFEGVWKGVGRSARHALARCFLQGRGHKRVGEVIISEKSYCNQRPIGSELHRFHPGCSAKVARRREVLVVPYLGVCESRKPQTVLILVNLEEILSEVQLWKDRQESLLVPQTMFF